MEVKKKIEHFKEKMETGKMSTVNTRNTQAIPPKCLNTAMKVVNKVSLIPNTRAPKWS